jgi:hypothetical protein
MRSKYPGRAVSLLVLAFLRFGIGAAHASSLFGVEMVGNATASTPSTGPLTNWFLSGGFLPQAAYLNSTGSVSSGTLLDPTQDVLYNFSAQSSVSGIVAMGDIEGGLVDNSGGLYVDYCGLEVCDTYSSTADSSMTAAWFDTLVFGGAPVGTPESFEVTSTFLSNLRGATYLPGPVNGAQITYSLSLSSGNCSADLPTIQVNQTTPSSGLNIVQTCRLNVLSGDTVVVEGQLSMDAIGTTQYGLNYSASASIGTDAYFTDPAFFLDPITPGATYTSASGMNYASVPEPGSVVLIGSGLMVIAILRKRLSRLVLEPDPHRAIHRSLPLA